MVIVDQIFLNRCRRKRSKFQCQTPRLNRRQNRTHITREQNDNPIFRRLLDGFQKGILRRFGHSLGLRNDKYFVGTGKWFDRHLGIDFFTHIIHTDTRQFSRYPDYIGLISGIDLFTGRTFPTWPHLLFCRTLKSCRKRPRHRLFATSHFTLKNIGMKRLIFADRHLQMFFYIFMSHYF